MARKIIALIDTLANDIAGSLIVQQHDATAIRWFTDVIAAPDSYVAKHLEDFQLVQVGILQDDLTITADRYVIITGTQWAAAQAAQNRATENNT